MDNLSDIVLAIKYIQDKYNIVAKEWDNCPCLYRYNQRNKMIIDIKKDDKILNDILNYRTFLNDQKNIILDIQSNNTINHVRIKQLNSVYSKLAVYLNKTIDGQNGTIAINKCFNDILGIRIISDKEYSFKEIKTIIDNKFPDLKCIDSTKNGYKATHVYFCKDNFHYQWELQIWYKGDEFNNLKSHMEHKQSYTKWENIFENMKGGLEWLNI